MAKPETHPEVAQTALRKLRDARLQLGEISETKLYDLVADNKLELVKIGTASRITQESIDSLIKALPRATLRRKRRPNKQTVA